MSSNHKTSQPDEIDCKILEILMNNPSLTDQEIGKEVGLSRESVSRRRYREGFQALLKGSFNNNLIALDFLYKKSISALDSLLGNPDPKVQLGAISLIQKFLPDKQAQAITFNRRTLLEFSKHPDFYDELTKIPGLGHLFFMSLQSKLEHESSIDSE